MNMNLFQETAHSSSASSATAAAAQRSTSQHIPASAPASATAGGNHNYSSSSHHHAPSATRGGTSLGVMTNVSKLFFASNRRASNESMYSTKSSSHSASGAARSAILNVGAAADDEHEEPLQSEEAFRRQQAKEQDRMDEFRAVLADVRLSHPEMSMAQAQHLAILRISERKNKAKGGSGGGGDRGSDDADGTGQDGDAYVTKGGDGADKPKQDRRRRRSLVAMESKDENKHRLLLDRSSRGEGRDHPPNTGGNLAVGGFLRMNARNLNPLTKALPISKDGSDIAHGDEADRNQPLLRRSSVRDPMLQSIRQLQDELGGIDLSDEGGSSHEAGVGYHSGSGSGGDAGSRSRSRRGSMFRRRGSHASRGSSGGRLRRRTSAASSRSDLSIRSERSLEAERVRKGMHKRGDGGKKKGGIRSSAKKLLRLGSHGSSKKIRDGDSESAGSSQSGDNARNRPKRRASQAPSLPDIGEDEDYEVPLKSDGDTSQSGNHLRPGGRRQSSLSIASDISIEMPVGDLICRWDNQSRDSIGGDSHISFDESDGLICGWANDGSSRRHTMAGSSSGDDFALALDDDHEEESENRRGSM